MSEFGSTQGSPRGGMRLKYMALLLFGTFAAGGVATWWLADEYGLMGASAPADVTGVDSTTSAQPTGNVAPAPALTTSRDIRDAEPPLLVAGAAVSADSARGEGLLLTYVVRRTIDDGAPLGYLAEQLRLRFGGSQPQAVATIISAAQAPVTRDMLSSELRALEPALMTSGKDVDLWTTIKKEFSELFVLRMDGAIQATSNQRFSRAQTLVEAGNVKEAAAEIALMPGANSARSWLARAQRYDNARAALKQLEEMALVRPINIPVAVTPPSTVQLPEEAPVTPTP